MINLQNIKIITEHFTDRRGSKALDIRMQYKLKNGETYENTILLLTERGCIQNAKFNQEETKKLYGEGFNFARICHPGAMAQAFRLLEIENLPIVVDETIDSLDKALRNERPQKDDNKQEKKDHNKKEEFSAFINMMKEIIKEETE